MIVKNSSKEKNTVTFEVELTPAEFEKHVNGAYLKNKARIQVPGFRKGKAPRMVIEGFYGKEVFYDEAVEEAANEAFVYGVEQEKLRVVGRPSLSDSNVTEEKGVVLTFTADVWPEVTLGQYKGLEAEKAPVEVTAEEIDAEVQRLRKQSSRMVTVDRPAQNGDTVNIDYVGTLDGAAFDGGTASGHDLVLGSNSFIPGFEEKLVGIAADEERDLDLTFPEEYHAADLAGKAVVFHVKCNAVKFEELPELDDEFAKDNDFDTVEELKNDISARLTETKTTAANNAFTDLLINAAAANMEADIPASMIEENMDSVVNEYSRYISGQGIPFEKYLKMIGTTAEAFRETTRATAEAKTRTEVLLDAVAKAEGLEISEEDLEAEYAKMAETYSMKVEDVRKYVDAAGLKEDLLRRKATAVIVDSGVPTAPKAEEKAEDAE